MPCRITSLNDPSTSLVPGAALPGTREATFHPLVPRIAGQALRGLWTTPWRNTGKSTG
ncbi:hypothetical protein D3C79_562650 [compost metagenome]